MAKYTTSATYDDVNLILRLYDLRREERMRKARAWFFGSFQPKNFDEMMKMCPVGSEENASMRMVVSYWDMVASFVVAGVLNEDLFFQSNRELLVAWMRVKPLAAEIRERQKDSFVFANLETVGESFAAWMNQRSQGSYESFAERLKVR